MKKRASESGIALITALLIASILFILGASFMGFLSQDYYYAARLNHSTSAYYLARAGLEYYVGGGTENKVIVPFFDKDKQHFFKLRVEGGNLISRGVVVNAFYTESHPGRDILAERTLIAPLGNLSDFREAGR
ncbi:MAG: hypothetical protein ABIH00_10925 [Armatimonadota bacterium]